MNILIAHHVEPIWNEGLMKMGLSFDTVCERIANWLERRKIDKIIITQFEQDRIAQGDEGYFPLFDVLGDRSLAARPVVVNAVRSPFPKMSGLKTEG